MSRIGTLAQANTMLLLMQQTQNTANSLQQQISTGRKSTTFAGISDQVTQLTNLQASVSQHQQFVNNIDTVSTRISLMITSTQQIRSTIQDIAGLLPNGAFNTAKGEDIRDQARAALASIGATLNSQDGTRFLFSGSATSTPAFDQANLPSPADLNADSAAGGYYGGDAVLSSAQIDQKLTVTYGVTADNPAFENAIRALNFLANLPTLPDPNNATDNANVSQASTLISASLEGLKGLTSNLALQQGQLTNSENLHKKVIALAQGSISNIEAIDPATVITQLNSATTQLQASYSAVSELQHLSLVNFLR